MALNHSSSTSVQYEQKEHCFQPFGGVNSTEFSIPTQCNLFFGNENNLPGNSNASTDSNQLMYTWANSSLNLSFKANMCSDLCQNMSFKSDEDLNEWINTIVTDTEEQRALGDSQQTMDLENSPMSRIPSLTDTTSATEFSTIVSRIPSSPTSVSSLSSSMSLVDEMYDQNIQLTNTSPFSHGNATTCISISGATSSGHNFEEVSSAQTLPRLVSKDIRMEDKQVDQQAVVFHVECDDPNLIDGYTWRKYGQKTIRDRTYPRGYYRCAHTGCPVKKQTELSSEKEGFVLITYFGRHNHGN